MHPLGAYGVPMYVCEACGTEIHDPESPDVERLVRTERPLVFGGQATGVEGVPSLFHKKCAGPYRRAGWHPPTDA